MKFVLQNCRFTGPPDFWLGRNHYPSQFYLLNCQFAENLADKPIGVVKDLTGIEDPELYERKFFDNCHREGGDYPWFGDNLDSAVGSPTPEQISANWTFAGRWDPETSRVPAVDEVETEDQSIFLHISECVTGIQHAEIVRQDGSVAVYAEGEGTDWLVFRGGAAASAPQRLELHDDQVLGTVATLAPRFLRSQDLPKPQPRKKVTLLLIGDSTVSSYSTDQPQQGWGWALSQLLDDRATIRNEARSGRSSKSFRDEGHWDRALQQPADYVLIQFGHNDNLGKGPERETDPAPGGAFRENLARYVREARATGAKAVLISPTTRRLFVEGGRINPAEKNLPYTAAVLALAKELDCPVIDLNRSTRELFERLGKDSSDWIQPVGDLTHFSPAGARRIAMLVLADLVKVEPDLQNHLLPDVLLGQ